MSANDQKRIWASFHLMINYQKVFIWWSIFKPSLAPSRLLGLPHLSSITWDNIFWNNHLRIFKWSKSSEDFLGDQNRIIILIWGLFCTNHLCANNFCTNHLCANNLCTNPLFKGSPSSSQRPSSPVPSSTLQSPFSSEAAEHCWETLVNTLTSFGYFCIAPLSGKFGQKDKFWWSGAFDNYWHSIMSIGQLVLEELILPEAFSFSPESWSPFWLFFLLLELRVLLEPRPSFGQYQTSCCKKGFLMQICV